MVPRKLRKWSIWPINSNDPLTTATVHLLNGGGLCEISVQSPKRQLIFTGNTKVDGVPDTRAPIICNYLDIAGANCGALLPTRNILDRVDGVEMTCVDNGMPIINLRATDFGITGYYIPREILF